MGTQKLEVISGQRLGFWNIISSALGMAVVAAVVLIGVGFLLHKLFIWAWPTLKWFIPLIGYTVFTLWFLYRATQVSDEAARSHRQYQAVVLIVRNLIILAILFADMRTVGL